MTVKLYCIALPALPMPDYAIILSEVQPDDPNPPKLRKCLSEYMLTYDPELEYQIDDIPLVPFLNQATGEFDTGLAKGSQPEKNHQDTGLNL